MPPYAGEFDTVPTEEVGSVAVASVEPTKLLTESNTTSATKVDGEVEEENYNTETDVDSVDDDDNKSTGDGSTTSAVGNALEMLMDFNPCMAMQSAVFKVRSCNHCGDGCTKMSGYTKEMNGDEKVYYHKWCGQVKEWKEVHSVQWHPVMSGLLAHFHTIQLEEEAKLAVEEAAVLEQARRREDEQRLQEEEAARLEAEKASNAARQAKDSSSKKKSSFGQKLKAFKASLNCRKNTGAAVLEI
mmetsp:Transcript_61234/g.149902  ORF Transcript_61234/g.149902 Transcript_61234/m.149902 type:complete len:243 (-) Transcript_61234:492-1220(-)|eukprot:CAMPEP_0113482008 /NCGR_PEP_ID=MMETSP0014_2-20120614/22700_1 /TAXON_ID=2857 /ORGANISM="Nitzschia sp." /LENGTH=242 /DNA_ID=CAMNT_0000375517 /DNA_START=245 /DNA_END=973 /DNA_ORIENTATION=- /assembly_acc=CAM_ASM_000159